MGQQLDDSGVLNNAQLEENKKLISEKALEQRLREFRKAYPPVKTQSPKIMSAGVELELHIVDNNFNLVPHYKSVSEKLSEYNPEIAFSPELTQNLIEVKTKEADLFNLSVDFEKLKSHFRQLVTPAVEASTSTGNKVILMGGHPAFNGDIARAWVTDTNPRYEALLRNIDDLGTNFFMVPFVDDDGKRKGTSWEAYAAALQTNFKVSHEFAPFYHDAANIVQPLLLVASASSPFIDRKATILDSTRMVVMPQSCYGLSKEHLLEGRLGRMSALEPLTAKETNGVLLDEIVLSKLTEEGIDPNMARYIAQTAMPGHLLVTNDDLDSNSEHFPAYTCWPWVKLKYDNLMDREGIVVELRVGEQMLTASENASLALSTLAMVQGVTEELIEGRLGYLSAREIEQNILICAENTNQKNVYWPSQDGTERKDVKDVYWFLANLGARVLRENGQNQENISLILDPVISKAGLSYTDGRLIEIPHEESPAAWMRRTAYEIQPDLAIGARMTDDTMFSLMDECYQKMLND